MRPLMIEGLDLQIPIHVRFRSGLIDDDEEDLPVGRGQVKGRSRPQGGRRSLMWREMVGDVGMGTGQGEKLLHSHEI